MELTEWTDIRGRRVAWRRFGHGPDVVFCHGTPWSAQLWAPLATALSSRFTVHLWDMPGYGASSKQPDHRVSLDIQGEVLVDLITQWHLDHPHVVAHDYGGAVALRAHLLHHVPFASLALVDVVALAPWGSDFFRLVRDHAGTFEALPVHVHKGLLHAYIEGASHRGLRTDDADMLTAPWLGSEGQAAFYRQIAQADQRYTDEIEPLYPRIDLPVMILWGEDDAWIPLDRAQRLAEIMPGARLRTVPDAGHLIQLDAPTDVAVELTAWLMDQPDHAGPTGPGALVE
jgi:pimeloyl-ACP methyl ester carboxylesterase